MHCYYKLICEVVYFFLNNKVSIILKGPCWSVLSKNSHILRMLWNWCLTYYYNTIDTNDRSLSSQHNGLQCCFFGVYYTSGPWTRKIRRRSTLQWLSSRTILHTLRCQLRSRTTWSCGHCSSDTDDQLNLHKPERHPSERSLRTFWFHHTVIRI